MKNYDNNLNKDIYKIIFTKDNLKPKINKHNNLNQKIISLLLKIMIQN